MSPEAQRIAIAKACGWTSLGYFNGTDPAGYHVSHGKSPQFLPDYLTDLNAIQEAVCGTLYSQSPGVGFTYLDHLARITGTQLAMVSMALVHATATQRAEAFLRTLGKWEDGR